MCADNLKPLQAPPSGREEGLSDMPVVCYRPFDLPYPIEAGNSLLVRFSGGTSVPTNLARSPERTTLVRVLLIGEMWGLHPQPVPQPLFDSEIIDFHKLSLASGCSGLLDLFASHEGCPFRNGRYFLTPEGDDCFESGIKTTTDTNFRYTLPAGQRFLFRGLRIEFPEIPSVEKKTQYLQWLAVQLLYQGVIVFTVPCSLIPCTGVPSPLEPKPAAVDDSVLRNRLRQLEAETQQLRVQADQASRGAREASYSSLIRQMGMAHLPVEQADTSAPEEEHDEPPQEIPFWPSPSTNHPHHHLVSGYGQSPAFAEAVDERVREVQHNLAALHSFIGADALHLGQILLFPRPPEAFVDERGGVWLPCLGQTVLRESFPELFGVIGPAYAFITDPPHVFRLPDLRERAGEPAPVKATPERVLEAQQNPAPTVKPYDPLRQPGRRIGA